MEHSESVIFQIKSLDHHIGRYIDATMRSPDADKHTRLHHWVIGYLYHSGNPVYQRDIEQHFDISRSTTSSLISLMEKKGLLRREISKTDARLKRILLTEKAVELSRRHEADMQRIEAMAEGALTPEEKKAFFAMTEKIRAVFSTDKPAAPGKQEDEE